MNIPMLYVHTDGAPPIEAYSALCGSGGAGSWDRAGLEKHLGVRSGGTQSGGISSF